MAWTTPKTDWNTGELVTAADLNAIGANLVALKDPATATYTTTEEITGYNGTKNVFVDVDTENLNLTITTTGRDVLVHFHGSVTSYGADWVTYFDIEVDGNRQGGDQGIVGVRSTYSNSVSFTHLIQNLSAGSHTFKLQWSNRQIKLRPSAQFRVREV